MWLPALPLLLSFCCGSVMLAYFLKLGLLKDDSPKRSTRAEQKPPLDPEDSGGYLPPEVPNPFHFRIHLNTVDKIKVALMTVFVLPIRIFLVTFFLFLTWLGCYIGLMGYSEEELELKPIVGWRRKWWKPMCGMAMRQMFWWGGLRWEFRGKKAQRRIAPLLVCGAHQSFIDGVVVLLANGPAPCTKTDSAYIPLLGTILRFIQPVFVKRSSKESRQTTLSEIKNRATSTDPWTQIVIFPEGTCSNGSMLLKFKQGAFSAGVPVQPVLIRYPNRLNTLTWTWDGPSALKTMWLTTCQWSIKMIIEYLPVYCPSEAERQDPTLYAENVRRLMAAALGIGTTEFSYDDLRFLDTGDARQPHHTLPIVKLLKFRSKNGLKPEQLPSDSAKIAEIVDDCRKAGRPAILTRTALLDTLGLSVSEASREMFEALQMATPEVFVDEDHDQHQTSSGSLQAESELVDLRTLLAAMHLANLDGEAAFKSLSENGVLSQSAFCRLCWLVMELPSDQARGVYDHLRPTLSVGTYRNFLSKHHQRSKGIVYFEATKKLVVLGDDATISSVTTSDDTAAAITNGGAGKRQKTE